MTTDLRRFRRTLVPLASSALALAVLLPRGAHSQAPDRVIPDAIACTTCRIVATTAATIADAEFTEAPLDMARDSRGRFYSVDNRSGLLSVYDPRGGFLRVIGRSGDGPGEYRELRAVAVGPGDTLFLFDGGSGRLTVLSPEYALVRMTPVRSLEDAVVLSTRRLVINAAFSDTARAGLPLHNINALGNFERSYGAVIRRHEPRNPYNLKRVLAAATTGGVWQLQYSFEQRFSRWTEDGMLQQSFVRRPEWFQPYTEMRNPSPALPSTPLSVGISQDADGLLWIATRVPDAKQRENLVVIAMPSERKHGEHADTVYAPSRLSKGFDTVIEVIDPSRGVILARHRFDGFAITLLQGQLAVFAEDDADGFVRLHIQRLTLQR